MAPMPVAGQRQLRARPYVRDSLIVVKITLDTLPTSMTFRDSTPDVTLRYRPVITDGLGQQETASRWQRRASEEFGTRRIDLGRRLWWNVLADAQAASVEGHMTAGGDGFVGYIHLGTAPGTFHARDPRTGCR